MPHHYKDQWNNDNATNIFWNIVNPYYNPLGCALTVTHDSVVEFFVRKFMNNKVPTFDLVAAHVLSLPFRGAFNIMKPKLGQPAFGAEETMTERAKSGLGQAPSVLLGQYILSTSRTGLHLPGISWKNVIAVALSQAVSQNLQKYSADWFPGTLADQKKVMERMFTEQKRTSMISQ